MAVFKTITNMFWKYNATKLVSNCHCWPLKAINHVFKSPIGTVFKLVKNVSTGTGPRCSD